MSGFGNRNISGLRFSISQEHYQFYCTTPAAQFETLELAGAGIVYQYYGSAVAVKIPSKTADASALKPIPTGSSREEGEGYRTELGDLEFMDTEAFRVNGLRQVQGITLHPQYVARVSEDGKVTSSGSLYAAWTAPDGHTPWSGAYMPQEQNLVRDILYDLAPSRVKKGAKRLTATAPDADWYQRTCIQVASSEEFGSRTFVIMESADGAFHCWPLSSPTDPELADPAYAVQKIKTNVPGLYARKVQPNYPAWVYRGGTKRDTFAARGSRETLEPRYVWYFNQAGTRAITAMVERKTIDLNYSRITVSSATPEELTTDVSIKMRAERQFYSGDTTTDPVQQDRLGRVELSLNIELTGENLEDFTFSVGVVGQVPPQDTDEGRLIASAYAMPTDWSRFSGAIGRIQPDDIIEARLFLYEHVDRANYIKSMDGSYGSEYMHQAIAVVYNTTKDEELLRFPLRRLFFEDPAVPLMNAGTFISTMVNRSYLGRLGYFDLSSLSFHYTVVGSITGLGEEPVETTTEYDRYLIYRRSRLRNIIYAFGQPVHVVEKGSEAVDLDEFIASTEPVEGVNLYPVNAISTIRGVFGVSQSFWWVRGSGVFSTFQTQFYFHWHYENIGTISEYEPALSAITQESFYVDYMMKVFNGIPSYSTGIGSKLYDMNINFNLEMWEEDIQWVLWQIFERARSSLANSGSWNESRVKSAFTIAYQHFTPGATQFFNSLYKPPLNQSVDDIIVRGFPYGELLYSNEIKTAILPIDSIHGKVLVHPEGHCSAFYKRLLVCGKTQFPVYNILVYNYSGLLNKNTLSLDVKTYGSAHLLDPNETFDQVLVDYVHFWDGAIQTTNNDLYNQAYGHSFSLDLYKQTLQMASAPNNEVGLLQDGLYVPLVQIALTALFLTPQYSSGYYSTPPGVSSTRLAAAFV